MSLIKLAENSNLDNLYSKPACHVVSEAVSMSKNTEAADRSDIAVSCSDVHGIQIGLR
jgi:catabolite regulation protein CreA